MNLGTQTGSLVNHVMSRGTAIEPQVGMGVTMLCWTDRYAGTIIEVTKNGFVMQEDRAIRTDRNGMSDSQSYRYLPNPNGRQILFRRVARGEAKGQWREGGIGDGSGALVGHRRAYHDYSF